MKNKFVVLLIAVLCAFAFALAACDSDKGESTVIGGNVGDEKNPPAHIHTTVYVPQEKSTCVTQGYEEHYICNDCGKIFRDKSAQYELSDLSEILLPLGEHTFAYEYECDDYEHWHITTCSEHEPMRIHIGPHRWDGGTQVGNEMLYECLECRFAKYEPISDKHEHTYDYYEWSFDEENHWHEATCGHDAKTDIFPHDFEEWVEVSWEEDGADMLIKHCKVCGYEEITEQKHEHTYEYGYWQFDEFTHFHGATCGHDLRTDEEPHILDAGVCIVCDYAQGDASTLRYELSADGESYVLAGSYSISGSLENGVLTVPDTYKGKPVTAVGNSAFMYKSEITEVHIGANVTEIRSCAFELCSNLCRIVFTNRNGLKIIGESAFAYTALESFEVPEGVTGIGSGAFSNCGKLTSAKLPDSILELPSSLFSRCPELVAVEFSDGLRSVGANAFNECVKLESIEFGDSLESIGANAFYMCSSLYTVVLPGKELTIGQDAFGRNSIKYLSAHASAFADINTYSIVELTVLGGDIEDNAFTYVHTLDSVTLRNVNSVGAYAFAYLESTSSVKIEGTIVSIGERAFFSTQGLNAIDLSTDILSVGAEAFANSDLEEVRYAGDFAAWCAIDFGESAFDGCSLYIGGEKATDLVLPSSVVMIKPNAFRGFKDITSVTVLANNAVIGANAFADCPDLTEIVLNETVEIAGANAFASHSICKAVLPVSALDGFDTKAYLRDVELLGCTTIPADLFSGVSLATVKLPDSVTRIENNAFRGCAFTEMDFPANLQYIGDYAFSGCKFVSLTVPQSVTYIGEKAFYFCSSLQTLKIEGNAQIGDGAFSVCQALVSVELDARILEVPQNTFERCYGITDAKVSAAVLNALDCTRLVNVDVLSGESIDVRFSPETFNSRGYLLKITVADSVKTIAAGAFENCVLLEEMKLPSALTAISDNLFNGCTVLSKIEIPSGIESIGANAFKNCALFGEFEFADGLKSIGENAFYGCEGITLIGIPSTVAEIGSYAFVNTAISKLTVPQSVTKIGCGIVSGCGALTEFVVEGNPELSNDPFRVGVLGGNTSVETVVAPYNLISTYVAASNGKLRSLTLTHTAIIGARSFVNCMSLTELILPDELKEIGESAFAGCSALESFVLPKGLETIGESAFARCSALVSFVLPEGLETIGDKAFMNCSSLKYAQLPSTVVFIGKSAFADCVKLARVSIPSGISSADETAFAGCVELEYYEENGCLYLGNEAENRVILTKAKDTSVTDITVYDEVKIIFPNAFAECKIVNATLPVFAFEYVLDKSALQSVVVTKGGSIPAYTFENCAMLKSVTLPSELKTVGNYAFYGCKLLCEIDLSNLTEVGHSAFTDCVNLTSADLSSAETVGIRAFAGCSYLGTLIVNDGIAEIGANAFYECRLITVTLPMRALDAIPLGSLINVTITSGDAVCDRLFANSGELRQIVLPTKLKSIGDEAFANTKLSRIDLPSSVNSIGARAFYGTLISNIYFSGISSTWSEIEFGADWYPSRYNLFAGGEKVIDLTIIPTVTEIKPYAFAGCVSLYIVRLPQSVTEIGEKAFYNCPKLKYVLDGTNLDLDNNRGLLGYNIVQAWHVEIYKPANAGFVPSVSGHGLIYDNSTLIGYNYNETEITLQSGLSFGDYPICDYALFGVEFVESLIIPKDVTSIGRYAFAYCINLTEIHFDGTVDEWNALDKGEGWNVATGDYTVYCTDGEIQKKLLD